ncbi:Peptidoglycan-N-acetylmuramic acid deacetylase PdaA [bacterium HR28]|nr:Peptidoglycan-N-acetylmuramic acid deacetylase PdaA [bacterium HR28]
MSERQHFPRPLVIIGLLSWLLLAVACRGPAVYPTPTTVQMSPSPTVPALPTATAVVPSPTLTTLPSPTPTPLPPATATPTLAPTPPLTPTPVPPSPTPALSGPRAAIITRLPTSEPVIALTFDCGADRGYAEEILDELARHGIRATFGMTGAWARTNPDLVARMLEEGHDLINHSDMHPSFTGHSTSSAPLAPAERLAELRGAEQAVAAVSGSLETMRPFFRPPYGDYDEELLEQLPQAGYTIVVMWTVDSLGWRGIPPEDVVERVKRAAEPGAIVLLHVGAQSTDAAALPALIENLQQAGYRFVTIRDILG